MGQVLGPVPVADSREQAGQDGRRASGPLVLVVDDDSAMRLLHAINLEAAGFVVAAAADGLAGVRLA